MEFIAPNESSATACLSVKIRVINDSVLFRKPGWFIKPEFRLLSRELNDLVEIEIDHWETLRRRCFVTRCNRCVSVSFSLTLCKILLRFRFGFDLVYLKSRCEENSVWASSAGLLKQTVPVCWNYRRTISSNWTNTWKQTSFSLIADASSFTNLPVNASVRSRYY